jgi:hypothetical protein
MSAAHLASFFLPLFLPQKYFFLKTLAIFHFDIMLLMREEIIKMITKFMIKRQFKNDPERQINRNAEN